MEYAVLGLSIRIGWFPNPLVYNPNKYEEAEVLLETQFHDLGLNPPKIYPPVDLITTIVLLMLSQ